MKKKKIQKVANKEKPKKNLDKYIYAPKVSPSYLKVNLNISDNSKINYKSLYIIMLK